MPISLKFKAKLNTDIITISGQEYVIVKPNVTLEKDIPDIIYRKICKCNIKCKKCGKLIKCNMCMAIIRKKNLNLILNELKIILNI